MKKERPVPNKLFKMMMEQSIPLHKFLGIELLEMRKGYGKVRVPFREEVMGYIRIRRWHGGIIATVMDSVGGFATGTHLTSFKDKISTIDMRIDYYRGAKDTAIIVDGTVQRIGSRTVFTKMCAWQEGSDELLAEAKGVYSIRKFKEPSNDTI